VYWCMWCMLFTSGKTLDPEAAGACREGTRRGTERERQQNNLNPKRQQNNQAKVAQGWRQSVARLYTRINLRHAFTHASICGRCVPRLYRADLPYHYRADLPYPYRAALPYDKSKRVKGRVCGLNAHG